MDIGRWNTRRLFASISWRQHQSHAVPLRTFNHWHINYGCCVEQRDVLDSLAGITFNERNIILQRMARLRMDAQLLRVFTHTMPL